MSTISASHAHCGVESRNICLNHPRNEAQGDHELIIGRSSMGFGTFCGRAANGKPFTAIGLVFPAAFCMNDSNLGASKAFGTRYCKRWFAFTIGSDAFAGNGRLSTANRFRLLWAAQQLAAIPLTVGSAGQRFISWLMNVAHRWRCRLQEPTSMINGRSMTLSFPLSSLVLRKNNIFVWTKGMILRMFTCLLQSPIIKSILLTSGGVENHCPNPFQMIKSIRLGVGWWNGLSVGWRKGAVFVHDGARKVRIGWPLFSSLVLIFCAILQFTDRF